MSSTSLQGPPPEEIKKLFNSISKGYDRANDVMTGGMARTWRKKLVQWSGALPGNQVLDCATGTGDLAIEFAKKVGADGQVIGTDFCQGMLDSAPQKALAQEVAVKFEMADATNLPYKSHHFHVVSIAYGIRNVSDPTLALKEMARVCQPGGQVMILETGDQKNPVLKTAINLYFRHLVPRIGGWITGDREAYEYLQKSSSKFPSGENFLNLMRQTKCFKSVEYRSLMGGASFIYKGRVH